MIELIVLDVDGCLTDGRIIYTAQGDEIKGFNVKDGLAIKSWINLGKKAAIISGRNSKIVERRARELGIEFLYQGISDKAAILEDLAQKTGLGFDRIAAIGDDLNDYKMLARVGLSFVPADASEYLRDIADVVLSRKGGDAAVREMIEYLLRLEGLENLFLKKWQG